MPEEKKTGTPGGNSGSNTPGNPGAERKGGGAGKGDRRGGRRGGGGRRDGDGSDRKRDKQDPFWYAKDQKALEDMANFPFLEIVGYPVGQSDDVVPGIVVLPYAHAVNAQEIGTNYASRAASAYYNYLTQGFTSSVPFEAPDLLMSAIASASLAALLEEGRRAFGESKYFLSENVYHPKWIMRALHWDFDDLNSNKANFRTEFNIRVEQFNKLAVLPKGFFISERWNFLASHIFTDTGSPEYSTAYAYLCTNYLKYEATLANNGTCLSWSPIPSTLFTTSSFFTYFDSLFDALQDEDVRKMNGALKRVYSDNDLYKVESLDESYVTEYVRHDIMRATVHNCNWLVPQSGAAPSYIGYLPASRATDGNDHFDIAVAQDAVGNVLSSIWAKQISGPLPYIGGTINSDVILDLYDGEEGPAANIDVSANVMVSATDAASTTFTIAGTIYGYKKLSFRSEIIEDCIVYYRNKSTGMLTGLTVNKAINTTTVINSNGIPGLSHLDSHPLIAVATNGTWSGDIKYWLGEIDKYTILDRHVVAKLHERCMFTLIGMPSNTKSTT